MKTASNSFYRNVPVLAVILGGQVLFAGPVFAQAPAVQTTVDRNRILIGQQLHLRVVTSMPDNTYRLAWFNLPDSFGNFKVVHEDRIDSTSANGLLGFSQDITLTSFDSGRQVIPSLTLNVETLQGDSSFNLLTDSIPVDVSFAPLDSTATFHDIKAIIEVKKQWEWWWWAVLAAAAVLLFFLAWFLVRRFGKKRRPDLFHARLSPYEEAMQSLDHLEKEHLEQDAAKEYHTRLTDIFRRYLSRNARVDKMHETTDELLMDLQEMGLEPGQLASFAGSLRMGAAVKFAKFVPAPSESASCLPETRSMIASIHAVTSKKTQSDT